MTARRKKNRFRRRMFGIISLVLISTTGFFIIVWWKSRERFVRYPEFGITIPEQYSIHGIDVSRYQQSISWEDVSSMQVKNVKLGFAFMKATEGIGNVDPQFHRNWKKAREAGIICGAYHFFIASKDGKMQAENFIHEVQLKPGDMPPVLDIEQVNGTPPELLKKEVKRWLETAENYYGVKPVIYTNVGFYNRYLGKEFDSYPLWIAHYYEPHKPRISRDWLFWQHSDEGRVNGILHKVDFNVFCGDSIEFRNFLLH
jgi:lysozyme